MIVIGKHGPSAGGYGYSIQGNDGEEELFIIASAGQSGHASVTIIRTSIDGGPNKILVDLLYENFSFSLRQSQKHRREPGTHMATEFLILVEQTIREWVNPSPNVDNPDKMDEVVDAIAQHYGFETVKGVAALRAWASNIPGVETDKLDQVLRGAIHEVPRVPSAGDDPEAA